MKVSPRSDYPVGVRPMSVEVPADVAGLYEGIYEVTLNGTVDIVFCPSLTDVAPPFRDELLPRDVDEITTATQARLASVLFASYSVTPNDSRSGGHEQLPGKGVVFYVTESEFTSFTAELRELSERLGGRYPDGTVADLSDHAVIEFVRATVIPSPQFRPADRAILQDATAE
jgi:hypothetical protein